MENGYIGEGMIAENMENVLSVDVVPAEEVKNPPFTLTPYNTGDGFEAFVIRFDEEYAGDLAIKIFSLMAEDFCVSVDDEEYSYAVRGARQTDPGYAMIAGPFDAGARVECRWGKVPAGVYTREDVANVDAPEDKNEETGKPVVIPFYIKGAQSVLVSKAFETILVDVTDACGATIAPSDSILLEADQKVIEGETELNIPSEAVYESMEIVAGNEKYHLVIRNSKNKKDNEQGPDAFMNVTGSFAGELCYKVGNASGEDDARGTYHTYREQTFGVDPYTGYFWGRLDEIGSELAFQVEEGLYAINVTPGKDASVLLVTTQGKEKSYPIPELADMSSGPTVMQIRTRSKNGIMTVKCLDKDGNGCTMDGIEIRTLSTTAHASDYLPAEFPAAKETVAEEPVVDEPAIEEPVVEEPVAEEPVAEEPAAEEPAVEEPVVEEPVAEEPVVEEPVVDEPAVEEPVVEEPVVEKPAIEEPVAEEPAIEESVVEEPAIEEPVVGEPVVEEPVVEAGYDESEEDHDEDGYDEDGYDEDGYDEDDYDEDGYDEDGYDEDGYDENGYDEDGYDEDGYDEDDYDEDEYEDESEENDDKLERVVREALSEQQEEVNEENTPAEKTDYSDRSVPLTEKVYRSAIENYFGPGNHGIDFWDSERKERPGDRPGRRRKRRPAPEPAPEVVAIPARDAEPAPEVVAEPAPEPAPEVVAVPARDPEPAPEVVAAPARDPEPVPEVVAEVKEKPASNGVADTSDQNPRQIKVSVYSSSGKKKPAGSQNGGFTGFLSSLVKRKK